MNKRLPGEAVLQGGLASEGSRRADPLPGMVKQQCPECRYFFAAPTAGAVLLCPDCAAEGRRSAA
jgi:hypothetical protein